MLKNKLNIIILSTFLIKLVFVFFFHEKNLTDEWSILFENFKKFNSYSYYVFDGKPIPSSYMPPLYFLFLYFHKIISFDLINFVYLVIFNQVLISSISIYYFYKICRHFFEERTSLIGSLIFSLFPLMIFSTGLISSATLQLFLYLLFFKLYLDLFTNKFTVRNLFSLIVVCALNLVLRGEFIIILLFSMIYLILINRKKAISGILILLCTLILITPYVHRNYNNTGKLHLVNSSGYALWKGNNQLADVEGFHNSLHPNSRSSWPEYFEFENLYQNLDKIEKNEMYETNRDKVFKDEAFKNISSNKIKYFKLYLKKIFSFYFLDLDSSIKNYYNPFHILPVILVGILSIPGIIIAFKKFNNSKITYLILITCTLTLFISIFFILPRYKISIVSFQILFSLFCFNYLIQLKKK